MVAGGPRRDGVWGLGKGAGKSMGSKVFKHLCEIGTFSKKTFWEFLKAGFLQSTSWNHETLANFNSMNKNEPWAKRGARPFLRPDLGVALGAVGVWAKCLGRGLGSELGGGGGWWVGWTTPQVLQKTK